MATTGVQYAAKCRTQLGYVEGRNNNTKYGRWFGLNYNAWCAMFKVWVAVVLCNSGRIPRTAATKAMWNAHVKAGQTHRRAPMVGDSAFWSHRVTNGIGHVSTVTRRKIVNGKVVGFWTVGGNEGNAVRESYHVLRFCVRDGRHEGLWGFADPWGSYAAAVAAAKKKKATPKPAPKPAPAPAHAKPKWTLKLVPVHYYGYKNQKAHPKTYKRIHTDHAVILRIQKVYKAKGWYTGALDGIPGPLFD